VGTTHDQDGKNARSPPFMCLFRKDCRFSCQVPQRPNGGGKGQGGRWSQYSMVKNHTLAQTACLA